MEYFQDEGHVEAYVEMVEGLDGRELIDILRGHLEPGSKVLELGMGPGKDLDILAETYRVTGSDHSEVFIERYRRRREDADLLVLDARTLLTERNFDCIYSNKVLLHLSRDEVETSLSRQAELLNAGGLLFHSFWRGDKVEVHHGLRFVYYTVPQLDGLFSTVYDVVDIQTYTEYEKDDSIYVIAKGRR